MGLTAERLRELTKYDPETGALTWAERLPRCRYKIGDPVGGEPKGRKYIEGKIEGYRASIHRLAWLHFYGKWPRGQIDHINGNTLDNRISNLRDVPSSLNQQNKRSANRNNETGYLGVYLDRGEKPRACIFANGRTIHLGAFDTVEAAHEAYVNAKRVLHPGNTI